MSQNAHLAALKANLSVGSRELRVEEEATSGAPKMEQSQQTTLQRSYDEFAAYVPLVRELAKALQGDLGEKREMQENIPPGQGSVEVITPEGTKGEITRTRRRPQTTCRSWWSRRATRRYRLRRSCRSADQPGTSLQG